MRQRRWWSLYQFPLAARRLGASVAHGQYNLSPLLGRKGVTTVHDVSFFIGPQWFTPKDRLILQKFVPRTVARSAKVITVSETSRKEIEHYIPAALGKTQVTPLALNPAIHPVQRESGLRQVAADFELAEPYLLTVSTRWPRKNMALAVDAVVHLGEDFPGPLVVTGKPGWGEEREHPKVRRLGYVTDEQLASLYAGATLYLAPSRHEGFGLPLLEAFASGCPVLCSSGGALPEVAGDAAYVEPSWQAEDWSATIASLVGDSSKLDAMRERGLERVRCFSWGCTASLTLDIYREVAG
ncbi:MAG: D-inositol-3-phosphate glycosyltransferase [Fimbriimonadaceae bacterium]|nr:D-inositol-3-phosphate glycosyltransferase [Fimbriimonadaceae bacterium]